MVKRVLVMLLTLLLMASPFASTAMACAMSPPAALSQHEMHLDHGSKTNDHHGKKGPAAPAMKSCAMLTCAAFQPASPTDFPRLVPQILAASFTCRTNPLAGHCPVPLLGPPRNPA